MVWERIVINSLSTIQVHPDVFPLLVIQLWFYIHLPNKSLKTTTVHIILKNKTNTVKQLRLSSSITRKILRGDQPYQKYTLAKRYGIMTNTYWNYCTSLQSIKFRCSVHILLMQLNETNWKCLFYVLWNIFMARLYWSTEHFWW